MSDWFVDQVLKMASEAPGGGISPAFLMGKEVKLTIGDVDVTKWIQDAQFAHEPGVAFGIKLELTMPAPQPKLYPQIAGSHPHVGIYDEAISWLNDSPMTLDKGESAPPALLDKVAKEMIEKQKGTPA
jgi:hypothetical protein